MTICEPRAYAHNLHLFSLRNDFKWTFALTWKELFNIFMCFIVRKFHKQMSGPRIYKVYYRKGLLV